MIATIYIENSIKSHPRVAEILTRFNEPEVVYCEHYREVFNVSAQNFRLQKQNPSLILASKPKDFVQTCPPGYGVGGMVNHYFSHMLNCVYDCRYCFLQGMYRSANYVVFINYEDFDAQIKQMTHDYWQTKRLENDSKHAEQPLKQQINGNINAHDLWFFSGYDCDSLVFEPWTKFIEHALNTFDGLPAYLELRTKSTQINSLLKREPLTNVVVAFSFTSQQLHQQFEDKVPSIAKRIMAMKKLQDAGWTIGLRLDPLIWFDGYLEDFEKLLTQLFTSIDASKVHSVTIGGFRLPKSYYQRLKMMYPENQLFAQYFEQIDGMVAFPVEQENEMLDSTHKALMRYVDASSIYTMR